MIQLACRTMGDTQGHTSFCTTRSVETEKLSTCDPSLNRSYSDTRKQTNREMGRSLVQYDSAPSMRFMLEQKKDCVHSLHEQS